MVDFLHIFENVAFKKNRGFCISPVASDKKMLMHLILFEHCRPNTVVLD